MPDWFIKAAEISLRLVSRCIPGEVRRVHLLVNLYVAVCRRVLRSEPTLRGIMRVFAMTKRNVFFVQVGSNDGLRVDPLRPWIVKCCWRGILIEPVQHLFEKLKHNYRDSEGLIFENAAIAETDGYKTLYRLSEKAAHHPDYAQGLGSFDKEVILKHSSSILDLEKHLIVESIPCLKWNSLVKKHGVERLDLVHIDAEGYDYKILRQIDFKVLRPLVVMFEYEHMPSDQLRVILDLLESNGYRTFLDDFDVIAIFSGVRKT